LIDETLDWDRRGCERARRGNLFTGLKLSIVGKVATLRYTGCCCNRCLIEVGEVHRLTENERLLYSTKTRFER
jgi:hypothetical protein